MPLKDLKEKENYLKEIDILRAFSVIMIFLYHYNNKLFKLGYLGVDIFFVISGFVITLTLKDPRYFSLNDLKNFYLKRIKRLYPALIFCVLLTTVFYLFFGFLFQGNNTKATIVSSLLGYSNFFFYYQSKDYFQQDFLNPFDHIWSLSVEMQFYIIYSIFLICIYKSFKKNSFFIFAILTFLSFLYFIILEDNLFFYNTFARFWEFGIGVILYFLYKNKLNIKKIFFILLFVFLIFFFFSGSIIINKKIEILFCLCLILILFLGLQSKKLKNFFIFKINFLGYLGKISYSFYLFHFPVLYFLDLYLPHNYILIGGFLLTFLLSSFSYFYVEHYFRYKKVYFKEFTKYNLFFLLGLIIVAIYSVKQVKFLTIGNLKKINYLERQDIFNQSLNVPEYYIIKKNNLNANIVFFILGDSLGQQYLPLLDNSKKIGRLVYFDSNKDCILKKDVNSEGCYKLINEINSSVNADKYLFISFYPQEKNDEIILLSNINFLLSKLTKDLNIIVNLPVELPFNGNTCLITFKDCDFSKSYLINNSATKRDVFNKLNIINPRVVSFDLLDLLCNKDNCNLNANNNKNILIFRDNIHLTLKGSQYLTSKFDIWFLDLLKKKF
jgi:hypothetical protein